MSREIDTVLRRGKDGQLRRGVHDVKIKSTRGR
jgi:hypothetical protein